MKPIIHASHLSMFQTCAESYRRRYAEGQIIPPGIAMVVGSGTHKGAETDMLRKIETGTVADLEEVKAAARDYITGSFTVGDISLTQDEKRAGKKVVAGACVDQALGLLDIYHRGLAPMIEPVTVERPWRVEVPGYPFDLGGRYDVEEVGGIRDLKTKGGRPAKGLEDRMQQLTLYGIAKGIEDDKPIEDVRLTVDWLVKNKTPIGVTRSTRRTEEDANRLLRIVMAFWGAVEKGVFMPCAPDSLDSWKCNPKWCGYYDTCPYARGHHAVSVPNTERVFK